MNSTKINMADYLC